MPVLEAHYTIWLVAVSVLLSIGSAYTALSLADRVRAADGGWRRRSWLMGGAVALGGGIWSMHYLGMVALRLPVPVYYYWPTVLLSLLLGIAASAVTLWIVSAENKGRKRLVAGALLMGGGIGGMHYVGMAAMRSSAMERYDPWRVGLSIVAAVVFSWMALRIPFAMRRREEQSGGLLRLAGGCLMGLGIASMHYIAMSAAHFSLSTMEFSRARTVEVNVLGQTGIAATVVLVLIAALGSVALDKRRFLALSEDHTRLKQAQADLLESEHKLREVNAMLSELSIRDGLTGLHNRRHFDVVLETEWRRVARSGRPISLLMIDVDCFKAMNDTYGHQKGDDCLRDVARVLEEQRLRGYDLAARYGGEEYVVLLPESDELGAAQMAEAIRRGVCGLGIEHKGSTAGQVLTVSVGVCCRWPKVLEDWTPFVREADKALYAAKRLGRNRVEVAPVPRLVM